MQQPPLGLCSLTAWFVVAESGVPIWWGTAPLASQSPAPPPSRAAARDLASSETLQQQEGSLADAADHPTPPAQAATYVRAALPKAAVSAATP
jgi:hypothetical protein